MCFENISGDFSANKMKKKGLNGYVYDFIVDYNIIDTSNTINIHEYLMKKHDIESCLELLKKCLLYYYCILSYKVRFAKQSEMHDSTYSY